MVQIVPWYTRLFLVFGVVGLSSFAPISWTLMDTVPEWCRNAESWEYKMPYPVMRLYALFCAIGWGPPIPAQVKVMLFINSHICVKFFGIQVP